MYQITREDIFGISQGSLYTPLMMSKAEAAASLLGELRSIASGIADYSYIITALKNIESLGSAKIEGTTGNLDDLYQEEDLAVERKKELKLFSAIGYKLGLDELQEILRYGNPIDLVLLRHLHTIITQNDPATYGIPGKLREGNVVIRNSKLGDIAPPESVFVPELIETYLQQKNAQTHRSLIQIATGHYQFESIHPFSDGNGRVGRLLITTYLLNEGWLNEPILNLSNYFEKNRDQYVENLREITEKKDYVNWVQFFLDGIIVQAEQTLKTIRDLKLLRENALLLIKQNIKGTAIPVETLDFSLNKLYFTIQDFSTHLTGNAYELKDPAQTAGDNIRRLEQLKILKKSHKKGRADVYCNPDLKKLLSAQEAASQRHVNT